MKEKRGADEYRRLNVAIEHHPPRCADDPRFIRDAIDYQPNELSELRAVCRRCPLYALCASYGKAAKPPAGVWAGSVYKPRRQAHEAAD
ncbi:WhiB family transcriptional regulator [Microbacterium imperiale]|uniref:4Fe-4S Wbl-type domain-containing protein n=1 Tax=Microbacterium imperiale TaxID=33884 RepID=A0A9W6M2Q3_9MICO|nr:WhiB family transcriptional regulator [Microbacterium imperiale]BFE39380.1 hypothetical protein GCM10017544_03360 [Microbacterium imperiale]GLJ79753.1 hypothetical protein GCM10017586_14350 [Microbacterium imperiale]